MSLPIISVENLSKAYRLGLREEVPDTLASAMKGVMRAPLRNLRRLQRLSTSRVASTDNSDDTLWALKDVSFDVLPGEVVGIIGRNGAGKSTLLKILSRITEPTSGRAVIRGRVSSLLEVGTGFHPELSGRDNIYMNGTILGMTKREIDRKFDQIVDFSGVEKFLDTPTKRYSSGMQVRLAFAVAAHLDPEILVIDEVLAVGDADFQKKCLGKMQDVASRGRTVIFVSHNMTAVQRLCTRVVQIHNGAVRGDGQTEEIIADYLRPETGVMHDLRERQDRSGSGFAKITTLEFWDTDGRSVDSIRSGASITIRMGFSVSSLVRDPRFGIIFQTPIGENVFRINSRDQLGQLPDINRGGSISVCVPLVPLVPGQYWVSGVIRGKAKAGVETLDLIERAGSLSITENDVFGTGVLPSPLHGHVFVHGEWQNSYAE